MRFEKSDFPKIKDIAKKNLILFVLLLALIPATLVGLYLLSPGHWRSDFRVRLSIEKDSLGTDEDTLSVLSKAIFNAGLFSQEDAAYFRTHAKIQREGENVFVVSLEDSRRDVVRKANHASQVLESDLGKFSYEELENEKEKLRDLVSAQTEEKLSIEEYLKQLDDSTLENDANELKAGLGQIAEEISLKGKQLSLIESKIKSLAKEKDKAKLPIFNAKADSLRLDIEALKGRKRFTEEQYNGVLKSSGIINRNIARVVMLEESIVKNSKRLNLLNALVERGTVSAIKIPYLHQASILKLPSRAKRIISAEKVKSRALKGFAASILVILLILLYNLSINPVVSTTKELEKFTNLPVLGAISQIKQP